MVKISLIFFLTLSSVFVGAQTNVDYSNIVNNQIFTAEITNYLKVCDSLFKHRDEKTPVVVIDSITDSEIIIEVYTETHLPYLLDKKINFFIKMNNRFIPVIISSLYFFPLSLKIKENYLKQSFPKQFRFLKKHNKYVNGFKRELVPNLLDRDYIKIVRIPRSSSYCSEYQE